jgi:endoglucanase
MKTAKPGERSFRMRRLVGVLLAVGAALLLTAGGTPFAPMPEARAQASFNYAEALQKAIFFYEAQISGPKPSWSRVTWRGPSALEDGEDVGHDLSGGWFDAGDHVKFGFAMASSATMLAWGGVEYRQSFADEQQLTHLLNNLRVANDYFIKAHTAPNELWGQVGIGGNDHAFWGSAEVMHLRTNRASFRIHSGCGGSDLAAETAAAMAASSIVFRPTDAAYANTLVSHARQLFAFAEATHPSFYVDCITDATNFYNSRFGNPNDEMAWAAAWLHRATGEAAFLTRARQLYPTMCVENGTTTPCFTWAQSWNDKHFGTYILMARATGEQQFHTDTQRWLDYWTLGAGRTGRTTPGGLMFVHNFGSIRYATNTAFMALVYADLLGSANPLFARYHNFAKDQVDYALGDNPRNSSYVCGFGNNPPRNPHHRTAHGTWVNSPTGEPNPSRHILYGGLVGGPDAQDDFSWSDDRNLFMRTEVATDFNAGFTGALARLAQEFGGSPLPNFPPVETPDDEIFIDAQVNVQGQNFTEIRAWLTNRSAWPSRILDQGTFRYYFTLEPNVEAGQITVQGNFSQCGNGNLSQPTLFEGRTYYVTVSCVGTPVYPGGQGEHRREVQFRIAAPQNVPGNWDNANDFSFQGLSPSTVIRTRRIPVRENGVRIWGDDPGPAGPDFSLAPTPGSVTVTQGGTAQSTINIARSGGFTGAVALSASGLPAGVTASFNPASATGASSLLTFTATGTATTGPATVTITGGGGGLTRTTTISLTVNPAQTPNFILTPSPASVTVTQGGTAQSTINIARSGGFTGAVGLAASGLPAGVTASFNPASATGPSSVLTFTATGTATTGASTVTVTGTGGGLTRTTTISLTVSPAQTPNFTLAAAPATVSVAQGASAQNTINITRSGGFTGAVALTASGLPAGVTAGFNPASATGASSLLTFTATGTAALGTSTVTVTGTGGGLTRTTTVNLTVTQVQTPNFTLTPSPASVSVVQGASAISTINIARSGGFVSAVALSAAGLPAGVTAAFNPSSATGTSSVLTFTATATATVGAATVTVTGTGGGLTRTATVSLTVTQGGGGGVVTATPVINANGPWFNENAVRLSNTATLTSLTVTIVIQRTPGVSFSNIYNTVGGQIQQSNSSTTSAITYTWTLAPGQTLGVGSGRLFAGQAGGTGTPHPTSGDTWSVTFSTGGAPTTQSGTF